MITLFERSTVAHDFETLEAAQAFINSDALQAARPAAGVTSVPQMWLTKKV